MRGWESNKRDNKTTYYTDQECINKKEKGDYCYRRRLWELLTPRIET
jgi:hypothetical protein